MTSVVLQWEKYFTRKLEISREIGVSDGNERWLKHGTSKIDPEEVMCLLQVAFVCHFIVVT